MTKPKIKDQAQNNNTNKRNYSKKKACVHSCTSGLSAEDSSSQPPPLPSIYPQSSLVGHLVVMQRQNIRTTIQRGQTLSQGHINPKQPQTDVQCPVKTSSTPVQPV